MRYSNFFTYTIVVFSFLFLVGCDDDEEPSLADGSLQIGLSVPSNFSEDDRLSNEQVGYYLVSVTDEEGNLVLSKERIPLSGAPSLYSSNPLSLSSGNYVITELMVFNTNDALMYVTPIKGAVMADSLATPLPITLTVIGNKADQFNIEMIPIGLGEPADYGYAYFGFTDGEYENFPVKIFVDEGQGASPLSNARIALSADGVSHYATNLVDNSTEVFLKAGASAYSITASHPDYESETVEISPSDLTNFQSTPLEVTLFLSPDDPRYQEHFFKPAEDSLYFPPSGSGSSEITINIGVTNAAPFDRTFDIGILADSTSAEEGVHYTLSSSSITVEAYDTTGFVTITGDFDELSSSGPKRLFLTLNNGSNTSELVSEYDLLLSTFCPFAQSEFIGSATVTSSLFGPFQATIEAGTQSNQIILKDFYSPGNDIVVTFDGSNPGNSIATVEPTVGWVSGAYGDVTVEGTSPFNGCENNLSLVLSHCVSIGCFPDDNLTIVINQD